MRSPCPAAVLYFWTRRSNITMPRPPRQRSTFRIRAFKLDGWLKARRESEIDINRVVIVDLLLNLKWGKWGKVSKAEVKISVNFKTRKYLLSWLG